MNRIETIRSMKATLERRREEICRSLDLSTSQLRTAFDRDVGDSVDAANDAEFQAISSQLAEVEGEELARIETALARFAAGDYGVCGDCGRKIPLVRLRAVPYTTHCIKCQRGQETTDAGEGLSESIRDGDLRRSPAKAGVS